MDNIKSKVVNTKSDAELNSQNFSVIDNNGHEIADTSSKISKSVGMRVSEARVNLNQADFADSLGISLDKIKNIEQGKQKLTIDLAIKIAKSMNVSVDFLCGLTNHKNNSANALAILNEYLNYIDNEENYVHDNSHFRLSINAHLDSLLKVLATARQLRDSDKIPNDLYNIWYDREVEKFFVASNGSFENKRVEYCLADA